MYLQRYPVPVRALLWNFSARVLGSTTVTKNRTMQRNTSIRDAALVFSWSRSYSGWLSGAEPKRRVVCLHLVTRHRDPLKRMQDSQTEGTGEDASLSG